MLSAVLLGEPDVEVRYWQQFTIIIEKRSGKNIGVPYAHSEHPCIDRLVTRAFTVASADRSCLEKLFFMVHTGDSRLKTKAFGVEPGYAPYRLRQARYQEMAEVVAAFSSENSARKNGRLNLLDVGTGYGRIMRYIEALPGTSGIRYFGTDINAGNDVPIYKRDKWALLQADLRAGLPMRPTGYFDIVICEQVLEHIEIPELVLSEIERLLRPGGLLIAGVPIFPNGIHLLIKYIKPRFEDRNRRRQQNAHCQAFSKASFLRLIRRSAGLHVDRTRGFRIISGGPLRFLEYHRWWWRLNRRIGAILPGLCTEIQVYATKQS